MRGGEGTAELIRRCFLNSDARPGPILKRRPGDSIESAATTTTTTRTEGGKCLLRRASRTHRDAEGDRDDAGRSNCETGGPITGPEITGPAARSIEQTRARSPLAHRANVGPVFGRIPRIVRLVIGTSCVSEAAVCHLYAGTGLIRALARYRLINGEECVRLTPRAYTHVAKYHLGVSMINRPRVPTPMRIPSPTAVLSSATTIQTGNENARQYEVEIHFLRPI